MSWLQLKLQMLPSIDREINSVIKNFKANVKAIDEANERGEVDQNLL